jgi:Zn-dependent M28 family amino/carboxypeptidase
VERLCTEFTPRSYRHIENLDRAAAWIEEEFRAAGLEVLTQDYEVREDRYRNVIAVRRGVEERDSVMVIGAHYDAYGDFPGADDNASGLAVLLELARTLPADPPRRTQYLVAFSTEEPPFFGSDDMGSYRFAKSLREEGRRVVIMVALDLVGRFSDEPGSQKMPFPGLGLLYPDRGNFVAVVGDLRSGSAIKRVRSGMLATGALPVRSFRAPAAMPGVHWSDHSSFRRFDMPSVLVTDTAYLRNPDYHTRDDTPDTLDYERMAKVVTALHGVLLGAR